MLPLHSVDMHLLVSDRELPFSSQRIFRQARLINNRLEKTVERSATVDGRTIACWRC